MQLTILGGAGVRTPLFMYGLARSPEGRLFDRVVLYDIDEERIALLGALSQYIVKEAGSPFEIKFTTDLVDAVSQADFVFAAIRVGQDQARIIDETVPMRYGILGQETTGPGGFAMALRTIPVMRKYAQVLKTHAPDAWLLNFTNPAGIITQAVADIGVKTVGICDSPSGMKRRLAQFLGVDLSAMEVQYFGLNHLGWISEVWVNGTNQLPYLLDHYEELSAHDAEFGCFDPELVRQLQCLPNEYLQYYYSSRETVDRISQSGSTRGTQIRDLNQPLFRRLAELIPQKRYAEALTAYQQVMDERSQSYMQREISGTADGREDLGQSSAFSGGYEEVALGVISSIIHQKPSTLILNVPNRGALAWMHEDDIVEVSSLVSGNGIRPLAIPAVPEMCVGLMLQVKEYERLTIKAALTGDIGTAQMALAMHPLVGSFDSAKNIVRDYLTSEARYLPQFAG